MRALLFQIATVVFALSLAVAVTAEGQTLGDASASKPRGNQNTFVLGGVSEAWTDEEESHILWVRVPDVGSGFAVRIET